MPSDAAAPHLYPCAVDPGWGSPCPYVVGVFDRAGRFGEWSFVTFDAALAYARAWPPNPYQQLRIWNRDDCDEGFDGLTEDERDAWLGGDCAH